MEINRDKLTHIGSMKTIKIITATEASKQLGFYEGEMYKLETIELKPTGELATFVTKDSGSRTCVLTIVLTGATIKMEEV